MRKNIFFILMFLFTSIFFGIDSVQIILPSGQTFVGVKIQFTIQNPDNTLQYKWNFGDGTPEQIGTSVLHSFKEPKTYQITCNVPNTNGQAHNDTKSFTVSDNRSIHIQGNSFMAGTEVSFDTNNFVDNNLKWNFGDGTVQNGSKTAKHTFANSGNYTVKVYDFNGHTSTAITVQINIIADNRVIKLNINNPSLYQPIGFSAENFSESNLNWDFGDGHKENGSKTINHFYSKKGHFKVIVNEIGSNRPVVIKKISINNDSRTIEITPYRINVGDSVEMKLKGSSVNTVDWQIDKLQTIRNSAKELRYQFIEPGNFEIICNIKNQTPVKKRVRVNENRKVLTRMRYLFENANLSFEAINFKGNLLRWDFGDGIIKSKRHKISHKYMKAGNYTLRIYDFNGKSKIPVIFRLRVIPDKRQVTPIYTNTYTGTKAEFKAKGFIANNIKWDFGDGTVIIGNSLVKHLYKSPGVYNIKLVDMGGRGIKKIITKVIVKKDRRRLSLPQKIIAGVPIKLGLIGHMGGNFEWKFDDGSNHYGNSLVAKVFHRVGPIKVTLVDKLRKDPPLTGVINVIRDTRSLTASVEAVLPNKKVVFTALRFLGKNIKWDFGDGNTKISAKKLISHTYSRLGTFKVTVSDFGGRGKKLFQKKILVSNILPGFRIENLEFTFSNGKYYTIAKKKQYKLDYNLKIKAVGSGILQGRIILDGVNLGFFDIYFNGSNIGVLNNSKKPKLPIIDLGMHRLSFEFINYNYSGQKPFLRYFVTEGKRIILKAPKNGAILDQSNPVKFTWTTPYKYLDYEYSYSLIPFQFLNDNQIKWKKATNNNSIFLDISKYGKGKYSYLIIRTINKSRVVKAISQIYSFKCF